MKQEYISLFEKAAPRMSDDELLNSVLSSRKGSITMKNTENKSKKRFSKAVVIPLAAALALGATAVGAVAVYNRNVTEEYARALQAHGDTFPQEYKNADGEKANQNAATLNNGLYGELSIELNQVYEYEDFTLEFPGAICDGEDILIVYNIVFNKNLKCLELPYQYFDIRGNNRGNGAQSGGRLSGRDFSERDGKTVYTSFYDFFDVGNCGDTLTVKFEKLSSMCEGLGIGLYRADIDVTLKIPLTSDFSKFNKTFEADTPPHIDLAGWGEWDIESADLRSLSISFNAKTDGEIPESILFGLNQPIFPIIVTMKDGSTLELDDIAIGRYYDYPENNAATFTVILNYPIDVENVQSVQFASAVIDVDGGSSTVEIPELVERFKHD